MKIHVREGVRTGAVLMAGVLACATVSLRAGAGPDDPHTPAGGADAKPANPMSMIASDPAYDVLKARAGTWDVSATFWLMPGAEPTQTSATCVAAMSLGGLYLEERIAGGTIGGAAGAIPWDVVSFTGYDAMKKEYHVVRFMSTAPTPLPERGGWDASAKVMETTGESRMVYLDLRTRTVATTVDADTRVVEQYMSFNGAPEFKGIRIELKRRK